MVEPISIAGGIANITSALPLVQDSLIYGANFMVSNTVGVVIIGMAVVGYGLGKIVGMFRSRRGRR